MGIGQFLFLIYYNYRASFIIHYSLLITFPPFIILRIQVYYHGRYTALAPEVCQVAGCKVFAYNG